MKICVKIFNQMVMHKISKKLTSRTHHRQWRYKNNYFKELTLHEFQVFIGLIYASSTRAESGINLWRSSRTSKHYFNAPANFGEYMNLHRFKLFENGFISVSQKWVHVLLIHGTNLLVVWTNTIVSEKNVSESLHSCLRWKIVLGKSYVVLKMWKISNFCTMIVLHARTNNQNCRILPAVRNFW